MNRIYLTTVTLLLAACGATPPNCADSLYGCNNGPRALAAQPSTTSAPAGPAAPSKPAKPGAGKPGHGGHHGHGKGHGKGKGGGHGKR